MEEDFVEETGIYSESDDEPDILKHERLLESLAGLDGKKSRKRFTNRSVRSEATSQVSEFSLGCGNASEKVQLSDLLGSSSAKGKFKDLRKKLNSFDNRTKVVDTPLPKFEQEKVQRSILYEKTTEEVTKWQPIVKKNRQAEQLSFPLQKPSISMNSRLPVKRFTAPQTPLEKQIAELLHGSQSVLPKNKTLTPAEERALKAMSLEEAKIRRAELKKYRMLLSYKEAKLHRQKKIKSKSFHRILRKEKMKNEKKAMDELQKSDPQAYSEKLRKFDNERIQERMSLKHRGGRKFMMKQKMFGKHDQGMIQSVTDMQQKSRDLTKKVNIESGSSSDSEPEVDEKKPSEEKTMFSPWHGTGLQTQDNKNPWMNPMKLKKVSEFSKPKELVNEIAKPIFSESEEETERESDLGPRKLSDNIGRLLVHTLDDSDTPKNIEVNNTEKDGNNLNNVACNVEVAENKGIKPQAKDTKSLDRQSVPVKVPVDKTYKKFLKNVKNKNKKANNFTDVSEKKSESNVAVSDKKTDKKSVVSTKPKEYSKKSTNSKVKSSKAVGSDLSINEIFDKADENNAKKLANLKKKERLALKRKERFKSKQNRSKKVKVHDASDEYERKKHLNDKNMDFLDVDSDSDEGIDEALERKQTLEQMNIDDLSSSDEEATLTSIVKKVDKAIEASKAKEKDDEVIQIDPKKILTLESKINCNLSQKLVSDNNDDDDGFHDQRLTIAEAFEDDDVLDDFEAEKRAIEDEDKPKDLDLFMPGWGSWGGEGIEISKKRRKKFIVKAPKGPERKDSKWGHVILSQKRDTSVAKYQVSNLPFPYGNIKQFESSIRAPIGRTWNPETSVRDLTKPGVVTKVGTIIEPMDESQKFIQKKSGFAEKKEEEKVEKPKPEPKPKQKNIKRKQKKFKK